MFHWLAGSGYRGLFRVGQGAEGIEEEEGHLPSITLWFWLGL